MRSGKGDRKSAQARLERLEGQLMEEVDALVSLMRSTRLQLDGAEKFSELTDYLEKFSRACTRLAGLLRELRATAGSNAGMDEMSAALKAIHAEVNQRKAE